MSHAPPRFPRTRSTVAVAIVTFFFGICILQLRTFSETVKIVPHRNVSQGLSYPEGDSAAPAWKPSSEIEDAEHDEDLVPQNSLEGKKWNKSSVLNGPPTEYFRANLRNNTYYLTSWSSAGFTNEFMNYVNMIYLATLTDRVPIIPPFAPDHHISSSAGILPFGDVFDLDALRDQLRMHILEWRDVKALPTSSDPDPYPYSSPDKSEPLGCWSTRKITANEPIQAENVVHHIGVDASYTRVPAFTRFSQDPGDPHIVFSRLAAFIYRSASFSSTSRNHIIPGWRHYDDPEKEPDKFEEIAPSPGGHHKKPEGQLACFDTMYYMTSGAEVYEWRFGFSPVWRTVGRWLRFNSRIEGLAKEYMKKLFGGDQDGSEEYDGIVPPFIAVHVRRGDFSFFCGKEDCYPQLSVYEKHVEDVKRELLELKGIDVKHVVLMSDEMSPTFWDEVTHLGWLHLNHSTQQTLERLGEWYLPIIDVAVQSYALGLVGTEESTFSLVSQKRVVDWNDGIIRSVNVASGT